MHGFLIQDWRTIRVAQAQTSFTQAATDWTDLAPCEDLSLWLDVRSVQAPGSGVSSST